MQMWTRWQALKDPVLPSLATLRARKVTELLPGRSQAQDWTKGDGGDGSWAEVPDSSQPLRGPARETDPFQGPRDAFLRPMIDARGVRQRLSFKSEVNTPPPPPPHTHTHTRARMHGPKSIRRLQCAACELSTLSLSG